MKKTNVRGGAKKTGLNAEIGKYVAFADQDDMIQPKNVFAALEFAHQNDVDMLACHFDILNEDGQICEKGIDVGDGLIMDGKGFCERFFQTGCNLAPWANLYKRKFLLDAAHPFEENVVMEDADWIAWHWIHAGKVGIFNRSIYTWIMNPASITHSQHYVNRADWIKYGYRKMRDAQSYYSLSTSFADKMMEDGKNNISGGMKRLWKVDNYFKFYQHLGTILQELQKMKWTGIVKVFINYPRLSQLFLFTIGSSFKLLSFAKNKLLK